MYRLDKISKKTDAQLLEAFASFPANTTSIDLSFNVLGNRSDSVLINAFKTMPNSVIILDLSSNNFHLGIGSKLSKLLGFLPKDLISLNLANNKLGTGTPCDVKKLINSFKEISNVTSLDLSCNDLNTIFEDVLGEMFNGLPSALTSLNLRGNKLGTSMRCTLVDALKKLPKNLNTLDLSANDLERKECTKLSKMLQAIPRSVVSLNLSCNALGKLTNKLIEVFQAIPTSVTSLDLSGNILNRLTSKELYEVLKSIHTNLISINLKFNDFDIKTHVEAITKALPNALISINLNNHTINDISGTNLGEMHKGNFDDLDSLDWNNNDLNDKSSTEVADALNVISNDKTLTIRDLDNKLLAEIIEIFKAISIDITSLDLSLNNLGDKTVIELIKIFQEIPPYITLLDLTCNSLDKKTISELTQVFKTLPPNIKKIDLFSNSLTLDHVINVFPNTVQFITLDSDKNIDLDEFRKEQKKRENSLYDLESHLLTLKNKAVKLKKKGFVEACTEANALHITLNELKKLYSATNLDYASFRENSMQAISIARKTLAKHRGCKELLANIALCILGLGVIYLTICACKGSFFKFNTDSVNKLNKLQDSIDRLAAPC
ncbi:hypothetical protein [Legionella sp.]|uniref:hypothetical protein n=1 Tax=Legionella sp. TaxID=459 RepID=UPI003C9AD53C